MGNNLSLDIIKGAVPRSIKNNITQEMVDKINDIVSDPDIGEEYREAILGYSDVMQSGVYKMSDYISAVKYVSYKLRGDTNMSAYTKTFPDRVARYHGRGVTDYSPWVTSYGKSKLVNDILGRSMIPTHILNADVHQKAINVLAQLMTTAHSEKVRSDSANSLLTHLKPPETSKIEIDINTKQSDGINDLREATLELVRSQKQMIESGSHTAKSIAHSNIIIDVDVEDI